MADLDSLELFGPHRHSDGSEGTDIHELVDSRLNLSAHHDYSPTPHSPATDSRSSESNLESPSHDRRRRSHKKDRTRYHEVEQELVKLLVSEGREEKQHRKLLRAALDKLDGERLRAQEAERRALELAERFRVVNDARMEAQAELARVKEELSYYKLEYDVAQRELKRGQEMLNHAEAQRDDAEATAARARSAAQRIKEKHLVLLAREEGRKLGYKEGLERGYEEGRAFGYTSGRRMNIPLVEDDAEGIPPPSTSGARTEPLSDLPMRNLPSPDGDRLTLDQSEPSYPPENPVGAQGSRFHENDITPSTTPFAHPIPIHEVPPSQVHPLTPIPPDNWIPPADSDNYISIPPAHEFQRPPPTSATPPPVPIPPPPHSNSREGRTSSESGGVDYTYAKGRSSPRSLAESVPSTTMSNFDLLNSPKSSSRNTPRNTREGGSGLSVIHEVSSSMEHSPAMDNAGMPEPISFPAGPVNPRPERHVEVPSAVVTSPPRERHTGPRLAEEVRYSNPVVLDEWRRTTADETRSASPRSSGPRRPAVLTMPAPLAEDNRPRSVSSDRSSSAGRSRTPNGGYGTPQRQIQPSRLRQSHTLDPDNSREHHAANTSSDIEINVEPPSAPESHSSPLVAATSGMLTPSNAPSPLPPPQPEPRHREVPTEPNTPTMGRLPSLGILPMPAGGLPPGFVPTGPPGPSMSSTIPIHAPVAQSSPRIPGMHIYAPSSSTPPVHHRSASTSSPLNPNYTGQSNNGRHSRNRSASGMGSMSPDSLQEKIAAPPFRPSSAMSGAYDSPRTSTPTRNPYASAPTPPGVRYPDPSYIQGMGRPPSASGTMSPRSISSRHQRSLSMNAGSTPGPHPRPLSGPANPPPDMRRVPSAGSMSSTHSRKSVTHYDPAQYVDPAYLASSEDLTDVRSPQTSANTKANAGASRNFQFVSGSRGSEPPVIPSLYSNGSGRKGR